MGGVVGWTPPLGSWASSAGSRRTMLGNRRQDSAPEMALRSAVHRLGLRFTVAGKPEGIHRSADLVFTRARVAVFLDGCYWHGCPVHFRYPTTNARYWKAKIDGNVRRDGDTNAQLVAAGWKPVRVWEHEPVWEAAAKVAEIVRSRRDR